jgi:RimJ/RimL family protein N-acetyltransferase
MIRELPSHPHWFQPQSLRSARLTLDFVPKSNASNSLEPGRYGAFHLKFEGEQIGAVSLVGTAFDQANVGYDIKPDFRRHGFATEAVAALLAAAPSFGLTLLSAQCHSANAGSRGVLEKTGFMLVSSTPWQVTGDSPHQYMVYERIVPETPQPSHF